MLEQGMPLKDMSDNDRGPLRNSKAVSSYGSQELPDLYAAIDAICWLVLVALRGVRSGLK
jgi:hypothetical protein